jgi:hypothetical protein
MDMDSIRSLDRVCSYTFTNHHPPTTVDRCTSATVLARRRDSLIRTQYARCRRPAGCAPHHGGDECTSACALPMLQEIPMTCQQIAHACRMHMHHASCCARPPRRRHRTTARPRLVSSLSTPYNQTTRSTCTADADARRPLILLALVSCRVCVCVSIPERHPSTPQRTLESQSLQRRRPACLAMRVDE